MWAGGDISFHAPIRVGDEVVKTSTIEDIAFKTGTTGPLGFVTVRHVYALANERVIEERQNLVYRPDTPLDAPSGAAPKKSIDIEGQVGKIARRWEIITNPVMLARFSAFTFNGHRIHYDAPYATGVEGYAGLVVHGPLQATLMLNIARPHAAPVPLPRIDCDDMRRAVCGRSNKGCCRRPCYEDHLARRRRQHGWQHRGLVLKPGPIVVQDVKWLSPHK
jgi:3-methylfumaryl-CoA hydratase